jgi:acetylornithine deacetylase/succinyl-diaminopimelate desuccinylase-like protein
VPDAYELVCDIRSLPGQDIQYITNELEKVLSDIEGCKLEVRGTTNPSASPPDDSFLQAIRRSLVKVMGTNVDIMQSLTIGFTDSSAVRPLGTIVYNFAPCHPDSDTSKNNVHGDNESISVDDLVFRTKVLAALAYEMVI